MRLSDYFGPSTLITAAFIGPGTLTICSIAGVESAYSLIWALVFSTIATLILQEMSARLGFQTGAGLPEAMHQSFKSSWVKNASFILIFMAIIIGNAAYEAGNISGTSLGLNLLVGQQSYWPVLVAIIGMVLIGVGGYKWIEKFLIALVMLMSICFLITAVLISPNVIEILKGLIPGAVNKEEILLVLGLVGTTVVPYNLFLHASIISKKYDKGTSIEKLRRENRVAVLLGGLISILIVIVAAGARDQITSISNAGDLALQLEPLLGKHAKILMGFGLFAAGLSSTITAALAAAYVAKGIFRFSKAEESHGYKAVWFGIILIGVLVSMGGMNTILLIKFAQIANAFILPVVTLYLLKLCNDETVMHNLKNKVSQNLLAGIVIFITLLISLRSLFLVFQS